MALLAAIKDPCRTVLPRKNYMTHTERFSVAMVVSARLAQYHSLVLRSTIPPPNQCIVSTTNMYIPSLLKVASSSKGERRDSTT